MPRLNGIEATQHIRQYEQHHNLPAIPIIAMTADVVDGTRKRAMEAGCTHWLPKPTSKEQFFSMIQQASPAATSAAEPVTETDQLTRLFLQDSLQKLELMEQQLDEQQWESLAENAHAVKGNALILGFEHAGTVMAEIQQLAEQQQLEPIQQQLQQFKVLIQEMESA